MYRWVQAEDCAGLARALDEVGLVVSGLRGPALNRAIARDALRQDGLLVNVALLKGEVVGFCLIILDWRRFWQRFLLRHPLLGARIVFSRLRARLRSRQGHAQGPAQASDLQALAGWHEQGPAIAKVLHLGVCEHVRGYGLGVKLYQDTMLKLRARGIRRVDNLFARDNHDSHRLHEYVGSRILATPSGFYAATELAP